MDQHTKRLCGAWAFSNKHAFMEGRSGTVILFFSCMLNKEIGHRTAGRTQFISQFVCLEPQCMRKLHVPCSSVDLWAPGVITSSDKPIHLKRKAACWYQRYKHNCPKAFDDHINRASMD